MNAWLWLAVHDTAAIEAGTYLVAQGHPWWAAWCFFVAAVSTVKQLPQQQEPPHKR